MTGVRALGGFGRGRSCTPPVGSVGATKLAPGIRERPLTAEATSALEHIAPARAELRDIDPTDLPEVLARRLHAQLAGALATISDPAARLALTEKVLTLLATETADATFHEQNLAPPPRILGSVYLTAPPRRPSTPLTTSTLLTRNRFEPTLAHEITCEVDSADSVDLLAAFITVGGVRSVRDALESLARRGARLRVLTTVFTGTPEIAALDTLAQLGAQAQAAASASRVGAALHEQPGKRMDVLPIRPRGAGCTGSLCLLRRGAVRG